MHGKIFLLRLGFSVFIVEIIFFFLIRYLLREKKRMRLIFSIFFLSFILLKISPILGFAIFDNQLWVENPNANLKFVYDSWIMWDLGFYFSSPFLLLWIFINLFSKFAIIKKRVEFPEHNINRKSFIFTFFIFINHILILSPIAGVIGFITAMIFGSKKIKLEQIPIPILNLPSDFSGYKIAQISDIHIGPSIEWAHLKESANILKTSKANILLITGDILDFSLLYSKDLINYFTMIKDYFPDGIIAVLGNHDFFDDPDKVQSLLEQCGVRVLRNKNFILKHGKAKMNIVGLDYAWPHNGVYGKRMEKARRYFRETSRQIKNNYPVIVMNHDPADYIWMREEEIDLVLSGHTHGGQVKFSSDHKSIFNLVSLIYPYYNGLYTYGRTKLYVNRGLGNSLPVRVNTRPEITILELQNLQS